MFMRLLALLFVLVCLCDTVSLGVVPKVLERLERGEPVKVVCIGDSITGVYYHTGGVRAYPEMAQIALKQLYPSSKIEVINAGISGDTAQGALARLQRDVMRHKPHLVTVMFGMNDLVKFPQAAFERNLETMVTHFQKEGSEVLLCTQNSIVDSPVRPVVKLEAFTSSIAMVAKRHGLAFADCHAAFERVRKSSMLDWQMLLSDAIHPNMDGHKLFAETIATAITGKTTSLRKVGPPFPILPHVHEKLKAGLPVKVFAMPPYDGVVELAIKRNYPNAMVTVKSWQVEGLSLQQIENSAKQVRKMGQDLVIIAVPASCTAENPAEFKRSYAWIMNWALSFGPQEWDVIAALPSTAKTSLSDAEQKHESLARRVIWAEDLHILARAEGETQSLTDWLATWVAKNIPPVH